MTLGVLNMGETLISAQKCKPNYKQDLPTQEKKEAGNQISSLCANGKKSRQSFRGGVVNRKLADRLKS